MSGTVLVVDDFHNIRELLKSTLEKKGFNIKTAENGKVALEKLKEEKDEIDLILTDFNMPEMNGQGLLEAIKSDTDLKSKPVVFLTTEKDPEKMKKAKSFGLDAWVKKPYKLDAFINQINHLINK